MWGGIDAEVDVGRGGRNALPPHPYKSGIRWWVVGLRDPVGVTSNVASREVLGGAHHESVGWGVRGLDWISRHLSSHAGFCRCGVVHKLCSTGV